MLARLCGVCIRYNDALYTLYYCVCIWLQLSGLVLVLLHVSVQHIYVFLQVAVCVLQCVCMHYKIMRIIYVYFCMSVYVCIL